MRIDIKTKTIRLRRLVLTALLPCLAPLSPLMAQQVVPDLEDSISTESPADSTVAKAPTTKDVAPPSEGMVPDSAFIRQLIRQRMEADSLRRSLPDSLLTRPLITSRIHLMTRSYGDRVYLRWVPEDYVSWIFLTTDGVNILRDNRATGKLDTLAWALKPLTEQQFRKKYNLERDSNAAVAVGVFYGEGRMKEGQTRDKPGSMGANVEVNGEQDVSFGFAMLVADWRPDLAQDMAVGFMDRTAKRGETYDYYVQPTRWDNGGKIIFEPGVREKVENTPYKRQPYDPQLEDTLAAPQRFTLSWVDGRHSSFEVERREVTDPKKGTVTAWERVNDKPYVSMVETDFEGLTLFSDSVSHDGTWEYRIMGHDPFGELTEPSPAHRAYARDILPPVPPQMKYIVIHRPEEDPMAKIMADVVWQNPEEPSDDCQGYLVKYYNDNIYGEQWHVMTDQLIAPTDTIAHLDVTGLRTGMLCVAAYDNSGNESTSMPQLIRITDYKAPAAPDSLRVHIISDLDADSLITTAYAILTWQPSPEDDDIAYFDLAFANDSTHEFMKLNGPGIHETGYVDTLAMDVNQKYVYYRVRAVDYSNNIGQWSPYIRVMRPHNSPPSQPHLGESSHDDKTGMHMDWIVGRDADMDYHILWRRTGEQGDWQMLRRWDADSLAQVKNWKLHVDDNPSHNRRERYYYMVESFNSSVFTSQSLAVSWLHQGPRHFDIPIKLNGDYVKHDGLVRLVWDHPQVPAALKEVPFYYCVFRKTDADKRFRYVTNVASANCEFVDASLSPGQQAQYYVLLRFEDGREGQPSNTITVARNN